MIKVVTVDTAPYGALFIQCSQEEASMGSYGGGTEARTDFEVTASFLSSSYIEI